MSILGSIFDKIRKYIDVHIKLLKVNLIGHTADIVSYLIFGMITLFILFCIILFLGFGLTELFVSGGLSKELSFFITIGVYILLLVIVFALRKPITRFFAGRIITAMTEDQEKKEKETE